MVRAGVAGLWFQVFAGSKHGPVMAGLGQIAGGMDAAPRESTGRSRFLTSGQGTESPRGQRSNPGKERNDGGTTDGLEMDQGSDGTKDAEARRGSNRGSAGCGGSPD
jgi:hypothetical protein